MRPWRHLRPASVTQAPSHSRTLAAAVHSRPVAVKNPETGEEEVAIRKMMYIALTYDHRLVDGREAVTFLRRVKQGVEDHESMLLE